MGTLDKSQTRGLCLEVEGCIVTPLASWKRVRPKRRKLSPLKLGTAFHRWVLHLNSSPSWVEKCSPNKLRRLIIPYPKFTQSPPLDNQKERCILPLDPQGEYLL
jgi:hypothetical protein